MTGHLTQDETDAISKAGYDSLTESEAGVASNWQNPKSGNSGSITPQSAYLTADGLLCRDYAVSLTIGDETEEASQTACRTSIGSWTTVADADS